MNTDLHLDDLKKAARQAAPILERMGYTNVDMVNLRRIFLLSLRDLYYTERNFESKELRKDPVKWRENKTERTIEIELDFLTDPNSVNPLPAIYMGFSDLNFHRLVIGDAEGHSEDKSTSYFECIAKSQLSIRHITEAPDFSYMLANHTLSMFLVMRPHLVYQIPALRDMKPLQLSGVKLTEQTDPREYRVDVTFECDFGYSWSSVEEGHRLQESIITTAPSFGNPSLAGLSFSQNS
ncbi:MAG: hypothetical protein EB168_08640 [Euryarchaeota archaeon]|nr:hypothetical protein [Euryarchaeota archaeon]